MQRNKTTETTRVKYDKTDITCIQHTLVAILLMPDVYITAVDEEPALV